jgi:hypothetical protein
MSGQEDNVSDHGDQGDRDRARDLAGMAGSYRAQTGHLTRVITKADALVAEAVLRAPSTTFLGELKRVLAEIRDQQEKCADICEDIRDAQEKTLANEAKIKGCLDRNATRGNLVAVQVTLEMAHCEITRNLRYVISEFCRFSCRWRCPQGRAEQYITFFLYAV